MIPRVGPAPDANRRYVLRPGAYAILPLLDGILLTMQTAPTVDIQLPGGGVDPGESPLRALHREVLEETGWRIARPRTTAHGCIQTVCLYARIRCLGRKAVPCLCGAARASGLQPVRAGSRNARAGRRAGC